MGAAGGQTYILCEPWFYEGREGYEVDINQAAKLKYFLIAPNHYRAMQKYLEKVDVELKEKCK